MRKTLLVLVLLALVWSTAWFALASLAGRQVDGFIAAEAREGRVWTCPDRHVSGFPLGLAVTCRDPTFAGQAMGQRVDAQAAGLAAELAVSHPLQLAITLAPPFTYKSSDGTTALDGTWRHLTFDVATLPAPRSLLMHGSDLALHGRVGGGDGVDWRAAGLDARVVASPPQEGDPTLAFAVTAKAVAAPALDAVLGGTEPVDGAAAGVVSQAAVGEVRTPEEALERWRRNGGSVTLSSLDLSRAGASVHADGTLALDEQHRPKGKLDASFQGLGPILARYGINGDVAALGSLLGTFFGGGSRATRPPRPGSLQLPVVLAGGRLGVGPITTAVTLSPLY